MSFLTAEWRKLAIANYAVEPAVLKSYLPFGTELDFWAGKCYVSLIGFLFMNTRLLGIRIPFHVNFEEVNLRFYVKRQVGGTWRRGVVFIKEIVPKPAIAVIANTFYNEKYETTPMRHNWAQQAENLAVEYQWKKNSLWQSIKVVAEKNPLTIAPGSETEFITEHYWGYAKVNHTKTNQYEVTHPKWQEYTLKSYEIAVDFTLNYGPAFSFLNTRQPDSVMLAEGSKITIENKKEIIGRATFYLSYKLNKKLVCFMTPDTTRQKRSLV